MLRAVGGGLYLTGAIIMTYNLIKTAYAGNFVANEETEAAQDDRIIDHFMPDNE